MILIAHDRIIFGYVEKEIEFLTIHRLSGPAIISPEKVVFCHNGIVQEVRRT